MHGSHDQTRGADSADSGMPPTRRCDEVALLLEAFHDGTLPAASARAVAEHVLSCPACRAALDELEEVYRMIRAAPAPAAPPELRQRLYARIADAEADQQRSARSGRVPMRFSEDVMYDTEPHPTHVPAPARAPRKLNVWLSSLAAVAVVALIAGVFFALPHNGKQSHFGPGSSPATSTGACAPGAIKASLPSHAYLNDLSMVSPTDGWAVGAIQDETNGPSASLILRFNHCRWAQVGTAYPNISLSSISMVSATDGWAVGTNDTYSQQFVLHYSGGAWHQVTLPSQYQSATSLAEVRMYAAHDGWIVGGGTKDAHGLAPAASLLHYSNGTWSQVTAPFGMIDDVAPVGPNDAWITGTVSDANKAGMLAHYHNGQWMTVRVPGGTEMTRLTAVSATDIWATGETPLNGNYYEGVEKAAVLHYDGSAWQPVNVGANPRAQRIVVLGDHNIWAFGVTHAANDPDIGNLTISLVQHQTGDRWQSVNLPITDLKQITALTRVGPDEYWAIGLYEVFTQQSDGHGGTRGAGYGNTVLLHYANGTWTQYGR